MSKEVRSRMVRRPNGLRTLVRTVHGAQPHGETGSLISTDGDGIGDATKGNLISGNLHVGLCANDSTAVVVAGNKLGTNAAGTAAVANGANGVTVDGSTDTRIGTNGDGVSDALERNLLSGNTFRGVRVVGFGFSTSRRTSGTRISGNYVGRTTREPAGACPPLPRTISALAPGATVETEATFYVPADHAWQRDRQHRERVAGAPPSIDPSLTDNTVTLVTALTTDTDLDADGMLDASERCSRPRPDP